MSKSFSTSEKIPIDKKSRQLKRRKGLDEKLKELHVSSTPSSSVPIPYGINQSMMRANLIENEKFAGKVINLSSSKLRIIMQKEMKENVHIASTLDLSDNLLIALPVFLQLGNIKILILRGNRLVKFEIQNKMDHLMVLNLSSNYLTEFPKKETIALMPSLRKLLLHNNKITEINISSIYALSKINIEVLNVSLNKIVVIPKELGLLNTLTSLNLSNNDITELPIEILKLRQLYAAIDSLDIRGNKLVRPPQEIAQRKGLFSIKDYFDSIIDLRNTSGSISGSNEYDDTGKISGGRGEGSLLTDFSKLQPFQTVKSRHLKLVMVGHENAGKSTIVRMLKHSNNGLSGGNYGGGSSYTSFNSLTYSGNNTFSGDNSGGNSTKSIYDMGPVPAVETGEEDIDREEDAGRLYSSSGFLIDQKLRDAAAKSCARFFPTTQQTQTQTQTRALSEQTQQAKQTQQQQQPKQLQQDVKINIWNFVGREIYRTSHEMFFSANALHMVVWDVEKSSSCIDYDTYIQFWIDLIQARAPGSTIMIVATHTDILDVENEALLNRYWQQYNNKNRNNYHSSHLNANSNISSSNGNIINSNSSTIPVVSREDLLQFIISEMQSHLQYNESLRISDLTCDINHLQSLPLRTEYDDEKIELLSKLLVNRPNIHPVVVPLATLDTDLRGIYQLINEIVQLTTPTVAPIIAPTIPTNHDTDNINSTSQTNNINDNNTLTTPLQQGNPHPFNILNIDIPLYYHLVKQQIDELRRRKTCGNSYCTIEELSNSVRAVQLGSSMYGNSINNNNSSNNGGGDSAFTSPNRASKRFKMLNKRNKQKITEERQAVLESYERTKNAIVYWATVGEIIWFPSSTSSEEDEYDSLYYTQLQHSHLEQYIESALNDNNFRNDNVRNDNGSENNTTVTANTTSSNNKKLNNIEHIEQNNSTTSVITRTNTSSSSNTGVFTATKQEELVFYTPRTDDIPITSYQHNYYNIIDEYYSNNSYDSSINSSSLPMNRYNRKRFDSDASGLSLTSVPSVTARNSEFYSENENELQYELDDYNHNNNNSNKNIQSNSKHNDGSDCSDDENIQTNTTNNTNKHNKVLRSLHNTLSQQQHKYNKSRINRQRSNSIDTYNTNNTIETEGSDFSDDDDHSYYVPVGESSSDTDQCNLDKVDRKDNCGRNSDRNSDSDSDSDEESDFEDRELDRSLLSSIVFLSPGWLKDSMKGLLDQDIRQKITDIEKLASKADMMRYFGTEGHTSSNHFNGVVQWDLIKELLLSGDSSASTSSLLQRMKHDTEKLEETLEILREVLIRLNIIIPIEKIRTPQEASYEYYDDYAITNNNSDRFGVNNYISSSERLDSSGDLVLEDDLHYTNRTHSGSGKVNNKLAINAESRELNATNNTNNTTNTTSNTTAYLLPSLLSEPSEKDTQQVKANFAAIDSIRLERRYSFSRFIPSNIVPRIIAKMYSKYGYVLKTNDYNDNNDNFSTYDNQHDYYNEDESDGNTAGDKNMSETDKNKCWSNTFIQEFGDCTVWVLFGPTDMDCPEYNNNVTNDNHSGANTAHSNNSSTYHNSSDNMCDESKGEHNWTAAEAHYFTSAAATTTVPENIKSSNCNSNNINNGNSNSSSYITDTTTASSTQVNTMQLRIISYGHLLHVQSVVKSLDHYSKVIDEILSEYKGISTLSSTTLCPVCQMKQYNEDECGIITNTIETNLRQSIYQLCNNNSYYLDLDSTEDLELLKGQYKTWDAENRIICNRHQCNIKPEFLIELPERITELFDPDEMYRNMTSYIRDDIINRSLSERENAKNNTQSSKNAMDDSTLIVKENKSIDSANSTVHSAQGTIAAVTTPVSKEDIAGSMVHVLPLHTTNAQLEELNKLFANRLNKRLSSSNSNENSNDGRVIQQDFFFWKVIQQVKVGDIMSGVRVKHPFRGGNSNSDSSGNNNNIHGDGHSTNVTSDELFILTAFIATRPAEIYQYFLIGDSRGWQHIAQYIIRPPKKIPGGYASDAALLRIFAVIDSIPINISNNILDIRIKYTPAFLYRDEGTRLYANSNNNNGNNSGNIGSSTGGVTTLRMCSLSIALEDNELQVEQVVQVWGFNGMSLNDGNWARIVLRTGECCLISLYSDQNLLGGPVLNEKGNVLGVFSKHIYKNSTQSAYFVASIRSLLM